MDQLQDTTLAQLVLQRPGAAAIFEKYSLDFCCKGKRSLHEACTAQGLDLDIVLQELSAVFESKEVTGINFDTMKLDDLINYIVSVHHNYARQRLPIISAHTNKVALRHGDRHAHLVIIEHRWNELAMELSQHTVKEEQVLFPYISRLAKMEGTSARNSFPEKPFVSNPIEVMEMEHDTAGALMAEIRDLTDGFQPPANACTTWRVTFSELKEFEEDLHKHVFLENSILFPKAIALEKELIQQREALN